MRRGEKYAFTLSRGVPERSYNGAFFAAEHSIAALSERLSMLARTRAAAVLAAPLLLLVTACTPTAPAPAPVDTPPASTAPSAPAAEPLPDDALLQVTATATADNGSVLDLEFLVHKSLAWDDPAAVVDADLMSQVCDGSLENSVYDEQLWSFTRVDVSATPVDGTPAWPEGKRFSLFPLAWSNAIAADGAVVDDQDVDIATPFCVRTKYLAGPGTGILVLGQAGDTDAVGAAGHFTRWANNNFGFTSVEVQEQTPADTGITVSDCAYVLTDLGTEFGGGADTWSFTNTDTSCSVGYPFDPTA